MQIGAEVSEAVEVVEETGILYYKEFKFKERYHTDESITPGAPALAFSHRRVGVDPGRTHFMRESGRVADRPSL